MTDSPCSAVERQLMCGPSRLATDSSASGRGCRPLISRDPRCSAGGSEKYRRSPRRSRPALPRVTGGSHARGAQTPWPPSTDWCVSRAASNLDSASQRPSAAPAGKGMDLRIRENQL